MLAEVRNMRGRQETLDNKLGAMKHENEALWRELALLRQKHMKQQQIVNKLIHFLVTLVQPSSRGGGLSVKRRYPLMIDDSDRSQKLNKLSKVTLSSLILWLRHIGTRKHQIMRRCIHTRLKKRLPLAVKGLMLSPYIYITVAYEYYCNYKCFHVTGASVTHRTSDSRARCVGTRFGFWIHCCWVSKQIFSYNEWTDKITEFYHRISRFCLSLQIQEKSFAFDEIFLVFVCAKTRSTDEDDIKECHGKL